MATTSVKPQSIIHKIIRLAAKKRVNTVKAGIESSSRTQASYCTSDDDFSTCSSLLQEQVTTPGNIFETITQIDFVERVLVAASSSTTFLIHFFNDETMFYFDLEEELTKILAEDDGSSYENYSCYRINSKLAPYVTSKLGIDPSDDVSVLLQFTDGQLRGQLRALPWNLSEKKFKEWLEQNRTANTSQP
eukprot:scaffold2557_cov121-Cylindrotheca_fusiformis.AAC.9